MGGGQPPSALRWRQPIASILRLAGTLAHPGSGFVQVAGQWRHKAELSNGRNGLGGRLGMGLTVWSIEYGMDGGSLGFCVPNTLKMRL